MTNGKLVGYVRVSTVDQNPERQLENIKLDKKFIDYVTGKTINRPQLQAMLDYVREDDTIIVHSMDRLGRTVKHLRELIDEIVAKGVKISFIKENLTFTGNDSPMSNLLLMIMGSIAEFEHSLIRERQLEGVALAKKAGKYRGGAVKMTQSKIELLKSDLKNTRKTKSQIAKELGVSRFTIHKYVKEIEHQQQQLT